MAVRNDFTAGEVLAAADLNDTFASKLDLAGGKILQIVRATDSTNRSTTSTSFVDVTGMSVTITPQKNNSAVLIIASFYAAVNNATGNDITARLRIADSSNNPISGAQSQNYGYFNYQRVSGGTVFGDWPVQLIAYATPATTSAVTYKLQFLVAAAATTATIGNATTTGQMYAIEVSA